MQNSSEIAELLRSHGLRSTPQRRAILAAFSGEPNEHLSADEVLARASESMPDLGRGTVYATLAELANVGLLAAFGAAEPVRYETNAVGHDHFRCRLCLRLFDYDFGFPEPRSRVGLRIERVEVRAQGVCEECTAYDAGLRKGVRTIRAGEPAGALLDRRGLAARELESPLGPVLVAASGEGVCRVAFEEHGDASALRSLSATRRGSEAARRHLDRACTRLGRYLDGDATQIEVAIDWEGMPDDYRYALRAAGQVPYAEVRPYPELEVDLSASRLGMSLGANPVPIVVPCHRVMRGIEVPKSFVGGPERRDWLLSHEKQRATS